MISDTAVARSARNCAKKDDRMSFFMVLAVSRREGIRLLPRFRHCVARLPAPTTRMPALTYTRITSCSSSADYKLVPVM